MKLTFAKISTVILVLAVLVSAAAAQSVNLTLKDGTRWRGKVGDVVKVVAVERGIESTLEGTIVRAGDKFIALETTIAGATRQKVIFFGDIVSITALAEAADSKGSSAPAASEAATSSDISGKPAAASSPANKSKDTAVPAGRPTGVFYLPLEGGVGEEIRHDEIEAIGKEADKYGPGQIIVLMINTNGGLVLEAELIDETLADLQKRHRVVAWVKKAISAGCSLAMGCSEIYFMSEGTAGSVTTVRGTESVPEDQVQSHIEALVATAKRNGYSEHVARAMKLNKYLCSYDKDPVTGDITWYGDLSGEFDLSDEKSNLCFNATNAIHCKFAKGRADTYDDLAKALDLPEWKEVNDYGRRIAKKWSDTVERAKIEIPSLLTRKQFKGASGGEIERLGTIIRINEELIRWIDRAPNIAMYSFGLQKEQFERENAELRKRLADIQRQNRR